MSKQCFKCQQFGHVQYRCSGKEVCAFCLEKRPFKKSKGPKGKAEKATCRNCKGNHPAFFRSRPKHPAQIARQVEEDRIRNVRESEVRSGLSYSDRVRASASKQVAEVSRVQAAAAVGSKVSAGSMEAMIEALICRLLPETIKTING